jgi:hypothetical protein
MHKIVTSIRQIAAADLPTITPVGEATRPMNEQELLNHGLVALGNDYYSAIHQETRDEETGTWKPLVEHPGAVISEGFLEQRHAALPPDVRAKIMVAHVERTDKKGKKTVDRVQMADVQPGDTVIAENVFPHSWAGEPKR